MNLSDNFRDSQLCELLAMTIEFAETFSSLLVEDKYLVTFYQWRFNLANNFCAFYGRSSYCDCIVCCYKKYLLKFYCCTWFSILNVVNKQFFASFCFKLLAVNFYNCVHYLYCKKLDPPGGCSFWSISFYTRLGIIGCKISLFLLNCKIFVFKYLTQFGQ